MRIGIDVSPLTRVRTGVGNYTYCLLEHLLQQDESCRFHGFSSGIRNIDLGTLHGLAAHRHLPIPTRALYRLWATAGVPRVDRLLGGLDLYHATNYFLPPTRSARRVVTFYDLAFLRVPELCSPKIVKPFSTQVCRFGQEADAILTCSQAAKEDIVTLCGVPPDKVSVAYGAVDESFHPLEPEAAATRIAQRYGIRRPFLLFVGTLEPRKNVEGLLRAFAMAAPQIPHDLVLAGGWGWNTVGIARAMEEAALANRVRQLGYVQDRSDLPAFYSAADAFVFPSFYEGFGLPVLEAMTCGCPVITSNRSSLPEVAGDAACCIDPEDTGALAEALVAILGDGTERAAMRAKGLLQANRFSWRDCARVTMDLYRSLV